MADQLDTCAVCLETLSCTGDAVMQWPHCGHPLHAVCALQVAQYDPRCPHCRCTSVPKRQPAASVSSTLESRIREALESVTATMEPGTASGDVETRMRDGGVARVVFVEGATAQEPDGSIATAVLDLDAVVPDADAVRLARSVRRRYQERRRRVIRSEPRLRALDERQRTNERERNRLLSEVAKEWAVVQRRCWNEHEPLVRLRKEHDRARDRAARARRALQRRVHDAIGEEPAVMHWQDESYDPSA